MPLTPNNREEHWLQGMVDGETTLTPNKRREYWYKEIIDAQSGGGGGGGNVLVCNAIIEGGTTRLDKTVSEILDAFPNVIIKWDNDPSYDLSAVSEFIFDDEDGYQIFFGINVTFEAQNLNDYPTHG